MLELLDSAFTALLDFFALLQGWLLENIVQPVFVPLGWAAYLEPAFDGLGLFLFGVLQLALIYVLFRPLEALWPVEQWQDRKAVRVDVLYTCLDRLGVVPLGVFLLLAPLFMEVDGWLRFHDLIPPQLEDFVPNLDQRPLLSFFIYLLIFDFAEYWRHRLAHTWKAWWALHAIHHSQRQMSFWADSRNHLLDNVIAGLWFAVLALLIGVPPMHFVELTVLISTVENLSHINAKISFGTWGERLIVSPRYHRWHHALTLPEGKRFRYGCNFAILFPIWDWLFGTQYLNKAWVATGIADGTFPDDGAKAGFWQQQWEGLQAMWAALRPARQQLKA